MAWFNTNQDTQKQSSKDLRTYLAIVRYAFPWMNLYVVEPHERGAVMSTLELVSGSNIGSGEFSPTYRVDDNVLVSSDKSVSIDNWSLTDYIVGLAATVDTPNTDIPTDKEELEKWEQANPIKGLLNRVYTTVKDIFKTLHTSVGKTGGVSTDILPGETHIESSQNVGIHVMKHITQIKCGHRNMVELDSVLNRIRIVTERMEYVGPLKNCHDMSGTGTLMAFEQEALTPAEGSAYHDEQAYALYRRRSVKGDMTMGWDDTVSVPSLDTHSINDVYRSKIDYTGKLTLASAHGFEIKKSMDVVSAMPITEDQYALDIVPEITEFKATDNKPDADLFFDRSINAADEAVKARTIEFNRVQGSNKAWSTTDATRSDTVKEAVDKEHTRKLAPIDDKQYYDLPEYIEIEDPHTKLKYKYYKSTSGFRHDPDGSLVFYDGYGSEIRMTRGNIIISPAADLILRPGRDLHAMSGRHTAVVSQKDVTVHSSLSDVYIKSQKSLHVISGIDGEGTTTIESRGKGTVIRSSNNTAVVGHDVFVGSISSKAPDTLDGSVQGDGTVIIGSGTQTTITGSMVVSKSDEFIAMSADGDSYIDITADAVTMASKAIQAAGVVRIGGIIGNTSVTVGNTTYNLGNPSEQSEVVVRSEVYVPSNVYCGYIQAEGGEFVGLVANNASSESGIHPATGNVVARVDWSNAALMDSVLHPMATTPNPTDVMGNHFVYSTPFTYPSSSVIGINKKYIIPGMLWQTFVSSGARWNEPIIPGLRNKDKATMVYPGADAWENALVTVKGYKQQKINGGYVVNG